MFHLWFFSASVKTLTKPKREASPGADTDGAIMARWRAQTWLDGATAVTLARLCGDMAMSHGDRRTLKAVPKTL